METRKPTDHWKAPPRLAGRHAVIEPMARTHVLGLQASLVGDDLYRCWYTSVPAVAEVEAWVDHALESQARGDEQPFVVIDASGAIVGSTRYYAMDPSVPKLSIGYTWYAPAAQRTAVNTEVKRLLLAHAFDALGCISVVFETSSFNQRSRAAIARLGARQDGVLRNHRRHADGTARDTVVFSILDREWPAVRTNLECMLQEHARGHEHA